MSEPLFEGMDLNYIVDDTLPPNTLRFEGPTGTIDFHVTWENGEMRLTRKGGDE